MVFFPFLHMYKQQNLIASRRTPAHLRDGASGTKGPVLSDVRRHPGSVYIMGGRHFPQNHTWVTRK